MLINKVNDLSKIIGVQDADIKLASLIALKMPYSKILDALNKPIDQELKL